MMDRRAFISGAPLASLLLVRPPYVPTGYLHAEDAAAQSVSHVTLNGIKVEHVFEGNDIEGWLRRLEIGRDGDGCMTTRIEYLEGEVRFHYGSGIRARDERSDQAAGSQQETRPSLARRTRSTLQGACGAPQESAKDLEGWAEGCAQEIDRVFGIVEDNITLVGNGITRTLHVVARRLQDV